MRGLPEPDWYETLRDFKDNENTFLSNRYEAYWKENDDDEIDERQERYGERFSNRRSASQYRKNALTTVMGAFLNSHGDNGLLYDRTGWSFQELNPFEMEDSLDTDILLAKPTEGKTLLVLLLPERESPSTVVEKSSQAIEAVQNNLSRFEYQAEPDEIHSAIVVNPPRDEETNAAIDSDADAYSRDIFVWRVYDIEEDTNSGTAERKILDHYANLNGELQQTGPNMHLLDVLNDGVEIRRDREILPDFFIQSHHSIYLEHIVGHVVQKRENKEDGPLTHFSRGGIVDYIENTLFERDVEQEAVDRAEYLLSRWEQMNLITPISASRNDINGTDFYRFAVNGRMDQDNIIDSVTEDYLDQSAAFHINIEAMENALSDFRDEYGEQSTLESLAAVDGSRD